MWLSFLSPAKLNLGLKIAGKRPDGYHNLTSIFCLINLFDNIQIQVTNTAKVSLVEHKQAWYYQTDLAYKAAILLQKTFDVKYGANIRVKKTIPSGSGLGGGSSNAATVLLALNSLWQLNLTKDELIKLGVTLGADVAFFIYGQNAVATGIGEIFTPIDLALEYFVLIRPDFHVSTVKVFNSLAIEFSSNIDPKQLILTRENDLLSTVCSLQPKMKLILADLAKYAKPHLTGSGSVIYLSFSSKNIAKKLAKDLNTRYNTYLVKRINYSPIYSSF